MPKVKEKEPGFEESLSSLERIVGQLESGDLPLEKALELFEEGVGLARRCQNQLVDAERKVELLLRERGEIKTIPFEASPFEGSKDSQVTGSPALSAANSGAGNAPAPSPANEDEEDDLNDSFPF